MKKLLTASLIFLTFSLPAFAHNTSFENGFFEWWSPSRLYIGVYQGYGVVDHMLHNDGQSAIGRVVFGVDAYTYQLPTPYFSPVMTFGAELGLQNGKTMRHDPPVNDPDASVDTPIQTTLNPVWDLLASIRIPINCQFYGIVKGGMAYRQLQFLEANYVHARNQISGEFQAGVGYELTPRARVVAYYQGIYANGKVNFHENVDTTVSVSNIPTQQAGFLGFELSF